MTDTNHHFFLKTALAGLAILSSLTAQAQPEEKHNLHFEKLAKVWDEALPLGNGTVGALIWERQGKLRLSLDRADIWDMRPMAGLHRDEFSYKWVQGQVRKKDYKPVQQYSTHLTTGNRRRPKFRQAHWNLHCRRGSKSKGPTYCWLPPRRWWNGLMEWF
jgi:hypothetical protein